MTFIVTAECLITAVNVGEVVVPLLTFYLFTAGNRNIYIANLGHDATTLVVDTADNWLL